MKCKKLFTLFVVAMAAAGSMMPSKVMADEQKAGFSVKVSGPGSVTLQIDGEDITVDQSEEFSTSLSADTSVHLQTDEEYALNDFRLNGTTVESFTAGTKNFSHDYVSTLQDAVFEVMFEDNQTQTAATSFGTSEELIEDGITIDFSTNHDQKLSDETASILKDYASGLTDQHMEARKAKAEATGLVNFCDEEYFLSDEFYSRYDAAMLLFDDCLILSRDYVEDGHTVEGISTFATARAANVTVNSSQVFNWSTNTPYGTCSYEEAYYNLSNGYRGFCAEGWNAPVYTGAPLEPPVELNSPALRKVLYYGFGGPGDVLTGAYGTAGAVAITSEMTSHAYSGRSASEAIGNGSWTATGMNTLYDQFMAKPDPAGFKAYICINNGYGTNWTGAYTRRQSVAYGVYSPTGSLQITKTSADPSITDGNSCYSLTGAEYAVYSNSALTSKVGTLTIQSNGVSNELTGLPAGTYYFKETKAPTGYALDTTVYSITVNSGTKATKTVKDLPQSDPARIIVGKIDKETTLNKPQGSASLANAQFTVKYYRGIYQNVSDVASLTPERTWVLKTDADGYCRLSDTYKVFGDAFYYNSTTEPTLPLGTVTIQETKAPEGYYIDNTVFLRTISSNGSSEAVTTYNEPIVKEQVISLRLYKVQSDSDAMIPGTQFTHTKPDGTTETVTTDSNGELKIKGLTTGRHTIQETKAADGYNSNPTRIVFDVINGQGISMVTDLTNTGVMFITANQENVMSVSDTVKDYSIEIVKQNENRKLLEGAQFTLYSDRNCTNPISVKTTGANGVLSFDGLKNQTTYYFKETTAPQGYRIPVDANGKPYVHEVYVNAEPAKGIFNYTIDGTSYNLSSAATQSVSLKGDINHRIISVTITNQTGKLLPETGSNHMVPLLLMGSFLMLIAMKHREEK